MSLDQGTIETLRGISNDMSSENRTLRALLRAEEGRIQEYVEAIEKLKETVHTLELANVTLRRRVESLEADRK